VEAIREPKTDEGVVEKMRPAGFWANTFEESEFWENEFWENWFWENDL
jgi:hypothetical protein